MKFKKTAIALVLAAFAFSLAAPMTDTTVFAAKGGARISAPKAAPSTSKASPSTGATKASSPNTKEYAPSKSAKSYSNEAPSAKTGANAAAAQTQSGSRWGSALRNIGLFAGGMDRLGLKGSATQVRQIFTPPQRGQGILIRQDSARKSVDELMHFFNPAPVMKLVEVIKGLATSEETTASVKALAEKLGKTPVEVNDAPGFVGNRIVIPMERSGWASLRMRKSAAVRIFSM